MPRHLTDVDGKRIRSNLFNVLQYANYKNGNDWSPAIEQIYNEVQTLGGGEIRFPKGTFDVSKPLPISPYISYVGEGYLYTIINYTSADTNNVVTVNKKNVTIKNLTIQGNVNQIGHGIQVIGTLASPIGEITIDNIRVNGCGKSGIHISSYVWMNFFNEIRVEGNEEHGFYDLSTDNTYNGIHASGNKKHGVYLGGNNNRISNVKSIFSGRAGTDYAGIYISGQRLQISNIEAQENPYDGIVFDGCTETVVNGAISDASGDYFYTGNVGTVTGRGFVFKNNCKHIIAKSLFATSFKSSPIAQVRGLDIDGTCSFLDINYDQNEARFLNDYAVNSSYGVNVTTPNSMMVKQYTGSGKILRNMVTDPALTSGAAFPEKVGVASGNYVNGIATITFDTFATKRVALGTGALTQGHLYYYSVKVNSATANALTTSVFRNNGSVPAYNNIVLKTYNGTGDYVKIDFLIYMFDADTTYLLNVGTSTNNAVVMVKEPMCIDLTSDLGMIFNPTKGYSVDPKFISEIIEKSGGFFAASKTI